MIEIERWVGPSVDQIEFAVEAMRNPMNSWDKSDSFICYGSESNCKDCKYCKDATYCPYDDYDDESVYILGDKDLDLMKRLAKAGTEHRTFMRMMPVGMRITAPLYWWKEMDRYTVGKAQVSCSTMHKIADKPFTIWDFSHEHLLDDYTDTKVYSSEWEDWDATDILHTTIHVMNAYRKRYLETKNKDYWWQLIQLLPSSYNQTRNVTFSYETLAKIYRERQGHKLDEWQGFVKFISVLPYSFLITGQDAE